MSVGDIIGGTVGGAVGYGAFLKELEKEDIGNVLFRTNSEGKKEFSPESLLAIMKAPFKFKQFWYPKLWSSNWVITTVVGIAGGVMCNKVVSCIPQ